MNLITDPWIPVRTIDGTSRLIAPFQIADPSLARLEWPRADLNIACLELLTGLVLLADPPADASDWARRQTPDPERLRERLARFAPAFDLLGDGPRFMQDRATLEGEPNPPDMLFIDSAGGQTIKNNADLMVWRDRYPALPPALAAMALYTLQAFAPSGGAGNRTSMRGGGPMVTMVMPVGGQIGGGLWATIWANVPDGQPATVDALPWMRATRTSETAQQVFPEQSHPVEAFFGMPRRLRLVADGGFVIGVIQRPYGTNYAGWDHPLTPYYRLKVTTEWLPKHPRAGAFGYRHWLGVVLADEADSGTTRRAQTLRDWQVRSRGRGSARVLVAGWAMDNMKPRDFILSTPPLIDLTPEGAAAARGLIEAAEQLSLALRTSLGPVLAEGESREAVREEFYTQTEAGFETALNDLAAGQGAKAVAQGWLTRMRWVALHLFEARALPGLGDRPFDAQQDIIGAHRFLRSSFAGYGKYGAAAFTSLDLPLPEKKAKTTAKEDA